jgi:hypothetical protein
MCRCRLVLALAPVPPGENIKAKGLPKGDYDADQYETADYNATISPSLIFVLSVILKSFIHSLSAMNAVVAVKSYGGPDVAFSSVTTTPI